MTITQKGNKIIIKANAPKRFKQEIGKLLNDLSKDYQVKFKDKNFEKTFKGCFKSNLYYIIDNYFVLKSNQKR